MLDQTSPEFNMTKIMFSEVIGPVYSSQQHYPEDQVFNTLAFQRHSRSKLYKNMSVTGRWWVQVEKDLNTRVGSDANTKAEIQTSESNTRRRGRRPSPWWYRAFQSRRPEPGLSGHRSSGRCRQHCPYYLGSLYQSQKGQEEDSDPGVAPSWVLVCWMMWILRVTKQLWVMATTRKSGETGIRTAAAVQAEEGKPKHGPPSLESDFCREKLPLRSW